MLDHYVILIYTLYIQLDRVVDGLFRIKTLSYFVRLIAAVPTPKRFTWTRWSSFCNESPALEYVGAVDKSPAFAKGPLTRHVRTERPYINMEQIYKSYLLTNHVVIYMSLKIKQTC